MTSCEVDPPTLPGQVTLLKRIDPAKRMDRWYLVAVQSGLFSPVALVRAWGSRRTCYQRVRVEPMADAEVAAEAAGRVVAREIGRGYEVVGVG